MGYFISYCFFFGHKNKNNKLFFCSFRKKILSLPLEHRLMVLMGQESCIALYMYLWLQRKPAGATLWVNNNSISSYLGEHRNLTNF